MLRKKNKRKRNCHKNNRDIVEEVVIFSNKKNVDPTIMVHGQNGGLDPL